MKKKVLISVVVLFSILFAALVAFSFKFNFMNFTTNSTIPFLVQATVISKNSEEVVFSEIKPIVFFDTSHVIARLRNRGKDLSLRPFNDSPSSSSTFSVEPDVVKDVQVGERTWLKYYPLDEKIVLLQKRPTLP